MDNGGRGGFTRKSLLLYERMWYWNALGMGSTTLCGFFPPFSFKFKFMFMSLALLLGVAVMSLARVLQRK